MLWPNLFWMIVGVDCQWVMAPCEGIGLYVVLTDAVVLPLLLLTLIGFVATLRFALRLLGYLFMSREERVLKAFKKQAEQASADYLRFYQ